MIAGLQNIHVQKKSLNRIQGLVVVAAVQRGRILQHWVHIVRVMTVPCRLSRAFCSPV